MFLSHRKHIYGNPLSVTEIDVHDLRHVSLFNVCDYLLFRSALKVKRMLVFNVCARIVVTSASYKSLTLKLNSNKTKQDKGKR
jgi:hypothetical protein